MIKNKIVLLIIDGFGIRREIDGNAIKQAKTPNIDKLLKIYPNSKCLASGTVVGLPNKQMGNSEVGHVTIGSGRIIDQDLVKINKSIKNKTFFKNDVLLKAISKIKKNNSSLHICGLLSDGGVHSHKNHLYSILDLVKKNNIKNVFIHCFLDGRDTPPKSGKNFIEELEDKLKKINVGKIATICGRYYSMDRDNRWDRIEKTYNAIINCDGKYFNDSKSLINYYYKKNITDEFVIPSIIVDKNKKFLYKVKNNDYFIFFNFRADRMKQLINAFCCKDFNNFNRKFVKLNCICFTDYDVLIKNKKVIFKKDIVKNTLGEVLSKNKIKQIRLAETEKYPHVTYFFNGYNEKAYFNEYREIIDSPKVATYDLKPEMSANYICNKLCKFIESKKYEFIVVNFANPDMLGHTGNIKATIKGIEIVDRCIGKIYDKILKNNYIMIICSDHGNSEFLKDKNNNIVTSHTSNKVPFILVNFKEKCKLKDNNKLYDIAPTILKLLKIKKPKEMIGKSIIL